MTVSRYDDNSVGVYSSLSSPQTYRISRMIFILLSLLLLPVSAIYAAELSIFSNIESHTYNDIAPIVQVIDSLEGKPVDEGENIFSFHQAELGVQYKSIGLIFFSRYDYWFDLTPDTTDIIYRDQNRLPLKPDHRYDIDLNMYESFAQGIALSYQGEWKQHLQFKGRLNYFKLDRVTDGYLSGELYRSGANGIKGSLNLDYVYTKDVLLDRVPEPNSGSGFSIDLGFNWQVNEHWGVMLQAYDLYSAIQWHQLTYTEAKADSNTLRFDDEGRLDTVAVLSGREWYRDYTQRLPKRFEAQVAYQISKPFAVAVNGFRYADDNLVSLLLSYDLNHVSLATEYYPRTHAIGLHAEHTYFTFHISSDDSDWQQARHLRFGLNVILPLMPWSILVK